MRLNNEIRSSIINAALDAKFASALKSLHFERVQIADQLYVNEVPTPPTRDPEWVIVSNKITISFEGFSRYRLSPNAGRVERTFHPLIAAELTMSAARPLPQRFRYGGDLKPKGELAARAAAYIERVEQTAQELGALAAELRDLLNSFSTFRQLEAAWPEGSALYARLKPAPRTTALVDPNLVARVTAKLTPPLASETGNE